MRLLLVTPFVMALPVAAETPSTPLDIAKQYSADGPLYAYDMEYISSEFTARGKVDPSQPKGSRITVTFPAKEDWPDNFEKGLEEIEADADGDIWCAGMIDAVPEDALLVSNENGIAKYTFTPVAEDEDDEKFMKHLKGTVDIDQTDGAILGFTMSSSQAFKPNVMVKIRSFRMSAECSRAPDGRTYATEVETKISGSAAMQSFDQQETQKITKLYSID